MLAVSEFGVQVILTATVFLSLLLNRGIRRIFREVIASEFPKIYKILAIYHESYFSLSIDI
jgi:hypothetical protein